MSEFPTDPDAGAARRPRAVASAVPLSASSGFSRRIQKIRLYFNQPYAIEVWLWALVLFFLTNPFTFTLMGQDPTVGLARNTMTMRREEGSQALIYMLRLGLLAFAVVMALPRWKLTLRALSRGWPIGLFVIWCALSVVWSDTPETSINSVFALFCLVVTSFLLAVRLPVHYVARALIYSGLIMALCSLFYVSLVPGYGIHQAKDVSQSVHAGAWRGVYLHKNHFGQLCAMYAGATFVSGPAVIRSQLFKWSLFALMLVLIAKSTSASAILILPIGLFLLWAIVALKPLHKVFAFGAAIAGGIIGILSLNIVLEMLGRDPTFSGRTKIWSMACEYIGARPMHGYGYLSTTYGGFAFQLSETMGVADPHNGFLDIALGIGLIGLLLYVFAIVFAWVLARNLYLVGGIYRQGILVMTTPLTTWLVTCMSESNSRPFGAVTSLGFVSLTMLTALPRAKSLAQKLPVEMRSWALVPAEDARLAERADPAGTR